MSDDAQLVRERTETLLREHPPQTTEDGDFLAAQYDAGLAWVHFPEGFGGLGLGRDLQSQIQAQIAGAGGPAPLSGINGIGIGMAAPTLIAFGTDDQRRRYLRDIWSGARICCQLFSEPGAGSDLAAVATRAVRDGDEWVVNGQKVWTSGAHKADIAILVARTDVDVPKHAGLTYFMVDMRQPGIDVRPLRQITGEAEFNEVFLTDVRIPDADRVGDIGQGWKVANATLNNERVAIGGGARDRETGMIGIVAGAWRDDPALRRPEMHDELMRLWVEAEVLRLAGMRLGQQLAKGAPGPESAAMKLGFARHAQTLSGFEIELQGEEGLRFDEWAMKRPDRVDFNGRGPGYRYLRAKGNSIEGGTSEIMRNVVAERVLGLPPEHRVDKDMPFKEMPR
ncbi:acyl-CoA dehydrogenase family protein [Actinomycetota bacterium]